MLYAITDVLMQTRMPTPDASSAMAKSDLGYAGWLSIIIPSSTRTYFFYRVHVNSILRIRNFGLIRAYEPLGPRP